MKTKIDTKHTPSRCDNCGTKTKPGSQFESLCRNSAACKRRSLVAAAPDLLEAAKDLIDLPRCDSHLRTVVGQRLRTAIAKAEGR